MKTVTIVILDWNGHEDTNQCLESIEKCQMFRQRRIKCQIVVVDNGSDEKFKVQNEKLKVEVKIIRNEKNLGFSEGNNVGIRYALKNGADYVLILNNDTLVHKNLIEELVKIAESDENIGIAAPKIYFAPGFEFHKDRYTKEQRGKVIWYAGGEMDWKNVLGKHRGVDEVDKGQYDSISQTDFASGCCLLVKREVLEKVGLFDESFFLYYEDSDLCQRVKGIGYKIVFAPKAILWHKNAGSAGGSGSQLQDYYITRNRLLFGMKYAPFRSKIALLRESLSLLFGGREWQRRGVADFYLGRFGKGSF